jgi:tungstate transport system ATP-binding protein
MTPLAQCEHLGIRRKGRAVLAVDHLAVEEGEVLAVIGPNGAGKSTLLLALACLLKPDRGRVLFRGQPIQDELNYRRRISLVLQEPLLQDTSVFSNVAAGLRFRGLPAVQVASRVGEWLGRLGIAQLRDRPARQLSGGEAQRTSLARAFVLQPELLLLDEPFSSLDSPTRWRLIDDLRALLNATGITTVFVTHDLDEALLLGDRVVVLLDGHIRQVGSPEAVFSAPADLAVAEFVGVETIIPAQVIASQDGRTTVVASGHRLEASGSLKLGQLVYYCLRPEDVTLARVEDMPLSGDENCLSGRLQRLTPQGLMVRAVVDCGFQVNALVARAAVRELKLVEGQPVVTTFKPKAAHLLPR